MHISDQAQRITLYAAQPENIIGPTDRRDPAQIASHCLRLGPFAVAFAFVRLGRDTPIVYRELQLHHPTRPEVAPPSILYYATGLFGFSPPTDEGPPDAWIMDVTESSGLVRVAEAVEKEEVAVLRIQ